MRRWGIICYHHHAPLGFHSIFIPRSLRLRNTLVSAALRLTVVTVTTPGIGNPKTQTPRVFVHSFPHDRYPTVFTVLEHARSRLTVVTSTTSESGKPEDRHLVCPYAHYPTLWYSCTVAFTTHSTLSASRVWHRALPTFCLFNVQVTGVLGFTNLRSLPPLSFFGNFCRFSRYSERDCLGRLSSSPPVGARVNIHSLPHRHFCRPHTALGHKAVLHSSVGFRVTKHSFHRVSGKYLAFVLSPYILFTGHTLFHHGIGQDTFRSL